MGLFQDGRSVELKVKGQGMLQLSPFQMSELSALGSIKSTSNMFFLWRKRRNGVSDVWQIDSENVLTERQRDRQREREIERDRD